MSVNAPTLVTSISTNGYRTEIDFNFVALQDFCSQVESELTNNPTQSSMHNLMWLDAALRPTGVVGTDSFTLAVSNADQLLTITHPANGSMCVIDSRMHTTSTTTTHDLSVLAPTEAAFRIAVGVHSNGAPLMSMVVVHSDDAAADLVAGIDLLLYTFTLTRTGNAYNVSSVQREAVCLLSRYSFDALVDQSFPIALYLPDALPAGTGNLNLGFIAPFDCEVVGAFGRLNVCPGSTATTAIQLRVGSSTVTPAYTMDWANAEDGVVRTITAAEPLVQVAAGSYVQVYQTVGSGNWSTASGLAITVLLRKLWVPLYV